MKIGGSERDSSGIFDPDMEIGRRWEDAVVARSVSQGIPGRMLSVRMPLSESVDRSLPHNFTDSDRASLVQEEHDDWNFGLPIIEAGEREESLKAACDVRSICPPSIPGLAGSPATGLAGVKYAKALVIGV